ncbi:hypothetical protein TrCOL_g13486 [Triparma columacea]|nr:hypothetical protein TrCOL_g13486 [Triparma columacea]
MNKNCPGLDYCVESWCYVDPVVCMGSKFLMRSTDVILEGEGAYYSYETCGGEDEAWQENKNEVVMKGKTFRVGVPAASYPLHYLEHKITGEKYDSGPWPLATDLDIYMSKYYAYI